MLAPDDHEPPATGSAAPTSGANGHTNTNDNTAELGRDAGGLADDLLHPLPVEVPGSLIGPYRLVRQIGEGGFGSVFLAEQEVPVRRSVAIKVVKLGMDTRQVVARFEMERQTLALMEHPNIARVLDAGTTASGRPYFVMELVKGEPIVAYCDRNGLSVRERVELIVDVCRAVQHAHTKGVLHRDIKPSNILIAQQDGRPTAKVIDFGIAKATGLNDSSGERWALTEQRQLIGTPEYMSPEQAEGSLDIDTRTDIYSIGVLLYELLTGTTPFSAAELRSAALGEIQRIIREVDPPRPSTRLSRSGETIGDIAARRRAEPATLNATIRGELDWIVMKALEKDRTRRYASANDFAEDIRRHLNGEAVLAAPPSQAYRIRKLLRRHRVAVGAASAVMLAIVVGAAAFAWQARVARAERDRALIAEAEQRLRAAELNAVADFQATMLSRIDVAAAGSRLLDGLRADFAEALADPLTVSSLTEAERAERQRSFDADLRRLNGTDAAAELIRTTLLRPSIEAIDADFSTQPLVDAALRHTLARTHLALGRADEALPLATQAHAIRLERLGERHRDTLRSLETLAAVSDALGNAAESTDRHRIIYETRRDAFGPDDPETLTAMGNLGNALRAQGKFDQAEPLLTEALAGQRRVRGNEARETLVAMNTLGFLHVMRGDLATTKSLWSEAYETGRRALGEDDPDVVVWCQNLAGVLQGLGELVEAEGLYRAAVERYRRLRGADHPSTITVLGGLGGNLLQQARFADAEPILREVYERSLTAHGPDHRSTLNAQTSLGSLLIRIERAAESETLVRAALLGWKRTAGEDSTEVIVTSDILGRALVGIGRFEECSALALETVERSRRVLGPEHPQTLTVLLNTGNALLVMRRPADAEPFLTTAYEARRRISGEDHRETILAQSNIGVLREQQGRLDDAELAQRDALERARRVFGADHPSTLNATVHLASTMRKAGRPGDAESLLLAVRTAVETRFPANGLSVATYRYQLGRALADIGRHAEAHAELLPGVERILAAPTTSAAFRVECLEAMASLLERWALTETDAKARGEREADAATWRARAAAQTSGER
jgi:eukaryotic-like serine/threonine-protein kinase